MNKLMNILVIIIFVLNISGCATTRGPAVSRGEIEQERENLKIKSLAFQIKQLARLNVIGNRLLLNIPKEDLQNPPQPFLGIICVPIDKYFEQLYNLKVKKGVVIIVIQEKSSAHQTGLEPGDVLLSVNKTQINNINSFKSKVSKLKIDDPVELEILRGDKTLVFTTKMGQIPINIPITMVDAQEVNAATDGQTIVVTYGLMNFAKSDDEIAAVLGHELAHAVRGHVAKGQGGQILTLIAALALGIVAENRSPGSGNSVMRGVSDVGNIFNASYSRDLEREADYFGAKLVYKSGYDVNACASVVERFAIEIPASMIEHYLSTHPSSPERVARIRKTIEELKTGKPTSTEQTESSKINTQ